MVSKKIGLIIVIFIIPLLLLAYMGIIGGGKDFFPDMGGGGPEFSRMEVNGFPLTVERAQTVLERQRGLSGRDSIAENQGLLFIFDEPDLHGIWMKEMRFPIDILWLDEGGVVLDIKRNALPESYPEVFYPEVPAAYVLELLSNFTELHNVKVGDVVMLPKDL